MGLNRTHAMHTKDRSAESNVQKPLDYFSENVLTLNSLSSQCHD